MIETVRWESIIFPYTYSFFVSDRFAAPLTRSFCVCRETRDASPDRVSSAIMTHFVGPTAAAALNSLRDNVHLAGRTGSGGTWYYPPTVLDEDGRLWGDHADHADRVLENRTALRHCYRSLLPDAPAPALLGRAGHVAAVESFVAILLVYYQPLATASPHVVPADLIAHTAVLLAEANVLYNIALAMRRSWKGHGSDVTRAAGKRFSIFSTTSNHHNCTVSWITRSNIEKFLIFINMSEFFFPLHYIIC